MSHVKELTRERIIQTLVNALKPLDYVHAFWEGGAAAFNRVDEWSDIDLYLVVDDNKVDESFLVVEKTLKTMSTIKHKFDALHPPEQGPFQAFYKLEDTSEYLMIDVAVFKLSSPDKFLEPEIHGNAMFYFNKSDKVKPPPLDRGSLIMKVQKKLKRLQANFDMFNNLIQKEINRCNYLEAIDLYRVVTLASIVEALRIRYSPLHHGFEMRYIHYELPSEMIKRLKHLFFVEDEKDLQEKYNQATEWFQKIMSVIDEKEIEKLIGVS